jgi:hypothetical protein
VDLAVEGLGTLVERLEDAGRSLLVARTREEALDDLVTTGVATFLAGVATFFVGEATAATGLTGEAARLGEADLVIFTGLLDRNVGVFLVVDVLVFFSTCCASATFGAAVFLVAVCFFVDLLVGLLTFEDGADSTATEAVTFLGDNLAILARPASDLGNIVRMTFKSTSYFR